jgi:hypothetical protein
VSGPKLSLDARAVAVFLEHPNWTKKQIAEALGLKATQSLSPERCRKLDAAMHAASAKLDPSKPFRRGSKDSEGNLEAWD